MEFFNLFMLGPASQPAPRWPVGVAEEHGRYAFLLVFLQITAGRWGGGTPTGKVAPGSSSNVCARACGRADGTSVLVAAAQLGLRDVCLALVTAGGRFLPPPPAEGAPGRPMVVPAVAQMKCLPTPSFGRVAFIFTPSGQMALSTPPHPI